MSAWDLEAANAFGYPGRDRVPGVDGYSRNLWDTTYDNWGPRVGAAYQINDRMVLRGGFGVTYLPSNTGYFSGPTDYGSANFSAGVSQVPYGLTPAGVPVGTFQNDVTLVPAIGGDPNAAGVYGIGEARFDRHFKNGRVMQWNAFLERRLGDAFMVSIGYSALDGQRPAEPRRSRSSRCRTSTRRRSMPGARSTSPPTARSTRPRSRCRTRSSRRRARGTFAGPLAGATIPRQNTLFPYPLLIGSNAAINRSGATSRLPLADPAGQPALLGRADVRRELHVLARDGRHRHGRGQPGLQRRRQRPRRLRHPEPRREPAHRLQRHAAPLRRDVLLRAAVRPGSSVHDRQRRSCGRSRATGR